MTSTGSVIHTDTTTTPGDGTQPKTQENGSATDTSNEAGAESDRPSVNYDVHVQNVGWQTWASDGELSGTTGKSLRLEALRIAPQGDVANRYSVFYRTHK